MSRPRYRPAASPPRPTWRRGSRCNRPTPPRGPPCRAGRSNRCAFPTRACLPRHYLLWAKGDTALGAHLFDAVLVDAPTGKLTAVLDMPWYLRALQFSRPLHYGDTAGLPLKLIWAALDLIMIVILGSGLYLWRRRARP